MAKKSAKQVNKYEHLTQPQESLDFHGRGVLSKGEIIRITADFIAAAAKKRLRRVLIITGKGLHSQSGPVVGPMVREVLAGLPEVKSFMTARRDRGGEGALEVELGSS